MALVVKAVQAMVLLVALQQDTVTAVAVGELTPQ